MAFEQFTIEDVTPDRLRMEQWHFVFVPSDAPTVRLVAYEEAIRQSTRHRFRDARAWYHPEQAHREWHGDLIARPATPQAIMSRVRVRWRSYFVFDGEDDVQVQRSDANLTHLRQEQTRVQIPLSRAERDAALAASVAANRPDPAKDDETVAHWVESAASTFAASEAPVAFAFPVPLKTGQIAEVVGKWINQSEELELMWHASVAGRCVGYGILIRDPENEAEEGEVDSYFNTLKEQAAYLLPAWRSLGLYSTFLRALAEAFGERIYNDALSTVAVRHAWLAASSGEPFDVAPTGIECVRSTVPLTNLRFADPCRLDSSDPVNAPNAPARCRRR